MKNKTPREVKELIQGHTIWWVTMLGFESTRSETRAQVPEHGGLRVQVA
jgi:hypothetical protein